MNDEQQKKKYIVVRGTSIFADWTIDLSIFNFKLTSEDYVMLRKVLGGDYEQWSDNRFKEECHKLVHPGMQIIICLFS